jgi:hypothetical protein
MMGARMRALHVMPTTVERMGMVPGRRPMAAGTATIVRVLCMTAALALPTAARVHAQSEGPDTPSPPSCSESATSCAAPTEEGQDPHKETPNTPPDAPKEPGRTITPGPSSDHIFGVIPNYSTVEGATVIAPISIGRKFTLASLDTFDPFIYPYVAGVALVTHSYGPGVSGFLKQYLAALTDNTVGNFMTAAVLPSALHQDPRYFERGSGAFLGRVAYAASRNVVTRSDGGHVQFNVSEIGGNAIAAGLSTLYYPRAERTMSAVLSRWGLQIVWDTLSNELKEFWPDIHRMFSKHTAAP